MMGHINNLVVELVRDALGEKAVGDLFDAAGMAPRRFQPELIYPESDFQKLFQAAQKVFGVGDADAEKAFAKYFMQRSPQMFPAIFELAGSARGLIERIPAIHRNFPASASFGDFREKVVICESTPARIVLDYTSPNLLCLTLRTVVGHCLEYFQETGDVHETSCQKLGDACCRIVIDFHGPRTE